MIPFHGPWLAFMATMVLLAAMGHRLLRGRQRRTQKLALCAAAALNVVFSTTFTFDLILDPAVFFPLTQNLPFHFCTLMTFLAAPAVWFDWRPLRMIVYFPGVLGGFLALVSPAEIYQGRDFISLNTLFYVVHALNVVIPVLMGSIGLYRPTARDAGLAMVSFFALAMIVLLVTLVLRAVLVPLPNYFYFFDPEGAGILVVLYDLIPIPIVYELPAVLLAVGVSYVQYGLYRAGSRLAARLAG